MKYHSHLLKKFISVNDTPENISKNLIVKACEINEVLERNISKSIVIGKVLSCEKHPDADRLNVCQVDCWKKWSFQIICGGENVKAWIYVPVALQGTVFAKAGITIEPRKMRWIESNGMICSKQELDINQDLDKHRIWDIATDLDDVSDTDLWTPLSDKYPWLDSYVLDVDNKSLTSRPDLTWHFGAGTELYAIYGKNVSFNKITDYYKHFSLTSIKEVLANATPAKRKVVSKTDKLNVYMLLELNNIEIQETSFFTKLQLSDMWSNPRNNRVDFSNLFMMISGQPVHFFDAEKVDGDIIVRNATEGEEFVDLFEAKHVLKETDIVIADKNKILALAWIVGGLNSWVTENTKNILVEIANFDAVAVRKTWVRLGLRTDAELRYEKNINPWRTLYCLMLLLDELKYYAKDLGKFDQWGVASYINEAIEKEKTKSITVDFAVMESMIFGKSIEWFEKIAKEILEGLGFNVKWNIITPPLWRSPDDMNIPADITEEVARIYGYDNITPLPLLADVQHVPYNKQVALIRNLEDFLVRDFGAQQTETYPWISEKTIKEFDKNPENFYSIKNPTNPEAPYLRDNMLYGLLAHTSKNSKFFDQFTIFDIGRIWDKSEKHEVKKATYASEFVQEQGELGVIMYQKDISNPTQDPVLKAKSFVDYLLKWVGITQKISFSTTSIAQFHPKKQAEILVGKTVVWFLWSIHPLTLKSQKIGEQSGCVYFSLNINSLLEIIDKQPERIYAFETSQDQILWRDLCFVVDTQSNFGEILDAIKAIPEVAGAEVFDLFAGASIGEGKKSVSIKIKIIGDGNMTTETINAVMDKAIKAAEKLGGKLRG